MKKIIFDRYSRIQMNVINEMAANPEKFVEYSEKNYQDQLDNVAEKVIESDNCSVILISGPSASGKTTTAKKLSETFLKKGVKAPVVSLDNFFLGKEHYQVLPDGSLDMESISTIDLDAFKYCVSTLLKEGKCDFPIFDFQNSKRSEEVNHLVLGKKDILIMEGIHALNPILSEGLPENKILKVYVSVRTKFMNGEDSVFEPKMIRLMRRMIRDKRERNHSPEETVNMWNNIIEGEKEYIDPYRDDVDIKIDTTLDYEPCIFHNYLYPILDTISDSLENYRELNSIYYGLEMFKDIDEDMLPKHSLLREFVGEDK